MHDSVPSCDLIAGLKTTNLLADKAYDSDKFLNHSKSVCCNIVVPPKSNRREQRSIDKHVYKEWHLVECFFAKLKSHRRISTRYEKLASTFYAMFLIAACLNWLR